MATDGAEPQNELTPSEIVLLHGHRFATHGRDVGTALKLFGVGAAISVMPVVVLFFGIREGELGSDMLIPLAMLAVSIACWAGGDRDARQALGSHRHGEFRPARWQTRVSSHGLASAMIEAALLANERAGTVRLEVEEGPAGGSKGSRLVVVPGPTGVEWPPASLEGRLVLARRRRPIHLTPHGPAPRSACSTWGVRRNGNRTNRSRSGSSARRAAWTRRDCWACSSTPRNRHVALAAVSR